MIEKAKRFCIVAHKEQRRKYSNQLYWSHCFSVAGKVKQKLPHDVEAICAAYLHDTVEDTVATFDDIEMFFSKRVARLVWEVTDPSRPWHGNRERRKGLDREHFTSASVEGKTIKLADMIDNSSSILNHDPDFAKVYMKEKQSLLLFLEGGDFDLYKEASTIVANYFRVNT